MTTTTTTPGTDATTETAAVETTADAAPGWFDRLLDGAVPPVQDVARTAVMGTITGAAVMAGMYLAARGIGYLVGGSETAAAAEPTPVEATPAPAIEAAPVA